MKARALVAAREDTQVEGGQRVTVVHLPVPGDLWQQILWRSRSEGIGFGEWVCRAAIEHGDCDPALREHLLRELATVVAHPGEHVPSDLPPAWLSGGVGMLPVETVAPLPARVTLKNYRHRGPSDSAGFSASLYFDDRRIGTATNDGAASSLNEYEFLDPADGEAFFAHAQAWGAVKGVDTHPDAELLDELCLELEDALEARKLIRAGAIAAISLESGPCWLPDNTSTEPLGYEDHGVVAVEPGEAPEEVAARWGCTRWRIVATVDPSEHRPGWRARPRSRRDGPGSASMPRDAHAASAGRGPE